MGVHLRFRILSILGLVTGAATVLAVACGGDDGSGPAACTGPECDGGASSETGTSDGSRPDTDGNTPPSDGGADGDADSSVTMSCGDGGPPGTLDQSFGDKGMVWLKYPGSGANAVLVQPDGKIVIGGYIGGAQGGAALVRLLPDGTLDPTFGTNGLVVSYAQSNYATKAVALQADGRIVAVGQRMAVVRRGLSPAGTSATGASTPPSATRALLRRALPVAMRFRGLSSYKLMARF